MIRFFKAKNGSLSASKNDILLHSKYNPITEAERFLLNKGISQSPMNIIIIEPALGYLIKEAYTLFPNSKILILHCTSAFKEKAVTNKGTHWYPETNIALFNFLMSNLSDFEILNLSIIEWEPSLKAFPECKYLIETVKQFLRERSGSIVTTINMGKMWIKNCLKNILATDHVYIIKKTHKPIVIASAGPTLLKGIETIIKNRQHISLWALSSALTTLNKYAIIPDLIIHTEASFYAIKHLYPLINTSILMSHTLFSTIPNMRIKGKTILLHENSRIELSILKIFGLNITSIPPHGTVAGSALLLALTISSGPIVFVGLDFCYNDINEHAQPHQFDYLYYYKANRTNPYYSQKVFKAFYHGSIKNNKKDIRYSQSFSTYAGWFNKTDFQSEVYRLNPSPISLASLIPIFDLDFLKNYISSDSSVDHFVLNPILFPNLSIKKKLLKQIIISWQNEVHDFLLAMDKCNYLNIENSLGQELVTFIAYDDIAKHLTSTNRYSSKINNRFLDIAESKCIRFFSYLNLIVNAYE